MKWNKDWSIPISRFIAQLVRASHLNREVNPVEVLNFFQSSLRNCINCAHNCEDHSLFHFLSRSSYWFISYTSFTLKLKCLWFGNNRELKQRRRQRQRERHKTMGLIALHVHVHFGTFLCRPLQNNNVKWQNSRFSRERDGKFLFLFLCFNTVHSNLDPGQLASIFNVKQIGTIAKKLRKREVIFWNDVFVAVAVVVA